MDIYRAQKVAEDRMLDVPVGGEWKKKFVLRGPRGSKNCEWLDPYLGLFTVEGSKGFLKVGDIPQDIDCELEN